MEGEAPAEPLIVMTPAKGFSCELVCCVVFALLVATAPYVARAEANAPGLRFLASAERAELVLLATVTEHERLDRTAWSAHLRIERQLAPATDASSPSSLQVVWEQLSGRTVPRLLSQQVVLIALDRLPSSSLWKSRGVRSQDSWAIAANGYAYLQDPAPATIDNLAAFLALSSSARDGSAGCKALAALVAHAETIVGFSALQRMAAVEPVDDACLLRLMETVANPARAMDLRKEVVQLVGERRLRGARAGLELLAASPGELAAPAWDALATIDGGLPDATVTSLLEKQSIALRRVGLRWARGALAERVLPVVLRADADPRLRAAAAVALADSGTSWGLAGAVEALADSSRDVRSAGARAIARLGPRAVEVLDAVIDRQEEGAAAAVATLGLMGAVGRPSLVRTARSHPNQQLRDIALLALGTVRDEHDAEP